MSELDVSKGWGMQRGFFGKLTIGGLMVAASFGIANAADMAVKAKAPPAPPFSWTGFYIGAYAGSATMDQVTTNDPCLVGAACPTTGTYNGVGPATYDMKPSVVAGGEVGYNWQPNQYLLLGLENKTGYLHLNGSIVMNPFGNGDTTASTRVGDWYDALTARVGYVSGQFVFFGEGGGVWTRVRTGVVDTTPPVTINTTTTKNAAGFAAGAGLEYAVNQNWSFKAEYLFLGITGSTNGCSQVEIGRASCRERV